MELDPESEAFAMLRMIQLKQAELQEETNLLRKMEGMIQLSQIDDPKNEFDEPYSKEHIEKLSAFNKKQFLQYFEKHPLKKKIKKQKSPQ